MNEFIVFILEDNDDDYEMIERSFQKLQSKISIKRFIAGEELIEHIECLGNEIFSEISFLLLDLNLPGLNGFDVLSHLNNDSNLKILPSIVFTTSNNHKDVEKAYALGANSYIVKPDNNNSFYQVFEMIESYWLGVSKIPQGVL